MPIKAELNVSYYYILCDNCHKVTLFFTNMKAFAKKILKFVAGTTLYNLKRIS